MKPDLKWSPSVFWETKYFKYPIYYKAAKVIWVKEGTAFAMSTIFLFGILGSFCAFFYHAPGPVFKTVLTPDLKSGIPQAVEMPAPVNAIKCLLSRTNSVKILIFSYKTSSGSKYYFLSS